GGAAPADQADCDVPRADESFDEFEARCNAAPEAAAPTAPAAPPPDCDIPRADESFDQFQARCGEM
ncbi:MAG: hypothetical protein M3Y87_35650, partial [Myxococcota bacterium]|nr:hypothetical protein [Myxococcota bacterium]